MAGDRPVNSPISDLPERWGSEFPFCTKPAGSAFLHLFLKEKWLKRPEEQERREPWIKAPAEPFSKTLTAHNYLTQPQLNKTQQSFKPKKSKMLWRI